MKGKKHNAMFNEQKRTHSLIFLSRPFLMSVKVCDSVYSVIDQQFSI